MGYRILRVVHCGSFEQRVYRSDTGLALHLSGATRPGGEHLENVVLTRLRPGPAPVERPNILQWRTASGAEVDFVIELPARLLPIEAKAPRRVTHADARHLASFLRDYVSSASAALRGTTETKRRLC